MNCLYCNKELDLRKSFSGMIYDCIPCGIVYNVSTSLKHNNPGPNLPPTFQAPTKINHRGFS